MKKRKGTIKYYNSFEVGSSRCVQRISDVLRIEMKKTFDSVKMQREIRAKLWKEFGVNQGKLMASLHKKFGHIIKHKVA